VKNSNDNIMFSISKKGKKNKITDDSGFLAIVNQHKYNSFVDENWELPQLFNHFVNEMNNETLIIWSTGSSGEWTVLCSDKPSTKKPYREFTKSIVVTDGQLCLTNYEDLTMAAQFADHKIPAAHNAELLIALQNGQYSFTVRQMFDPEDYDYEPDGKVNFEIIMRMHNSEKQPVRKIFWQSEYGGD
jgi:hypothetical protein